MARETTHSAPSARAARRMLDVACALGLLATVPANEAFRPMSEGGCSLLAAG